MKKKPNYRFWTRTRNTGVKFLYVAITLTGIIAHAKFIIKKGGSVKRNHGYRTGVSIKMLSSYLYISNTLHKFSWEHCKMISVTPYKKTLAFRIVFIWRTFIRLNTFFCAIHKSNFYHIAPQFHIRNTLPAYARNIAPKPITDALSCFVLAKKKMHRHIRISKNVIKYLNHISVT